MGCRYHERAQEIAVQGPGLLHGVRGLPPVPGPSVQGAHVHDRGHPAGDGCVRGGKAATEGPGVWPVAPSNMSQAEHAVAMCRALRGEATDLLRAQAAQSFSNRPTASLALLHSGSRAWCLVVVALEPHSSALRVYDCGKGTALTIRPAHVEALQLSALSGDRGTAPYL